MTELHLDNGILKARILTRGATLAGLWLDGGPNLVLGFRDAEDFQRVPIYAGCVVGPIANRVTEGRVPIGDQVYRMDLNEGGRTTLHGGRDGTHQRDWKLHSHSRESVTLVCTLPDGACGLPGDRGLSARYAIDGSTMTLTLTGQSDADTALNLAHHPYWTLGRDPLLRVSAEKYLPVDDNLIPTGHVAPVEGTPFDLRQATTIPDWLDHCFVLADADRSEPELAAVLDGEFACLRIETTAPGLQVYVGAHLPSVEPTRCDGTTISPHAGVAIEPQGWPDSPNQPGFPSILLSRGNLWRQVTRYCF